MMFINLCSILSIGASIKIVSIKNLDVTIKLNQKYSLPKTVTATMSDKSIKNVSVIWDKKTLDTSKIGNYTFRGVIKGYTRKVILVVKIIDPTISNKNQSEISTSEDANYGKWCSKKDLPFVNETKSSTSVSPGLTMTQANYDDNKAVACGNRIIYIHNDGKVKEYDPINDLWMDKYEIPELKESNGDFKLVTVKNLVYIVGVNFRDILIYDPTTNKSSFKTKLPAERSIGGVVSANDKIYILGGLDIAEGCSTDSFDEYDPNTDIWKSKAHLNEAANTVLATEVNNSIYIIGLNIKHTDSGTEFSDTLEVYDFDKDSWSIIGTLKNNYRNVSIKAVNGKIYILRRGADLKTKEKILHVEEYDPKSDKLTPRANTTERDNFACVVFNGEIYIFGGKKTIIPVLKDGQDMKTYFDELKAMKPSDMVEYIKTVEKYTPPIT